MEELAKKALMQADFPQFFAILMKINHSYERHKLAMDAIEVASQQENIAILKELATIELDLWYSERLFAKLIEKLIGLNAFDTAVGLIVVYDGEKLAAGKGWYLLAKELLAKNDFAKVGKVYGYIVERYQQVEIAKACLAKLSLPKELLSWLEWFGRYSQLENYISSDLVQPAINALSNWVDFPTACLHLQKVKNSPGKQNLLVKLYLYLLANRQPEKCNDLTKILPEELNWLVIVGMVLEDESQFSIFIKLENNDAKVLINTAIVNLITRQATANDETLASIIIQTATLAEKYSSIVFEAACEVCLKQNRLDTIIKLLSYLEKYSKLEIMLALVKSGLRIPQYEAILQNIDDLNSTSSYPIDIKAILDQIPKSLVETERNRRAQELIEKTNSEFAPYNNIHSHHAQYKPITQAINQLFLYNQYQMAYKLCRKLVASKARDRYVLTLFRQALTSKDFATASEIIKLFVYPKDRQSLQTYLAQHQKPNYREALKGLLKLKISSEFTDLMHDCVDNILEENDTRKAVDFLISVGMLSHYESSYYYEANENTIKRKIIRVLLTLNADDKSIRKLIQSLTKQQIEGLEVLLLAEFLQNNRLAAAFYLLNYSLKETYLGRKELPYELQEQMERYLIEQRPNREILKALTLLQAENLVEEFVNKLFKKPLEGSFINNIEIITQIPILSLRINYLIETIIHCIRERQFTEVSSATNYLPQSIQNIWLRIIHYCQNGNIIDLLNLLMNGNVINDQLLHWAIERWVEDKSPSYLLDHLQSFYKVLQEMEKDKPHDFLSEAYRKYVDKSHTYTTLFKQVFLTWSQLLLKAKAYQSLLSVIADLLLNPEKLRFPVNMLSPIQQALKELLEQKNYSDALAAIKLIMQYESYFPSHLLDDFLDRLLAENLVDITYTLIEFTAEKHAHWHESATLKICRKLAVQGNYKEVFSLLSHHQPSYSLTQEVKKWVINLIDINKLGIATQFIDQFLNKSDEHSFIEIIEHMLAKEQVAPTARYLQDKIQTPGTKLRLQSCLQKIYLRKLEGWIGKERAEQLYRAHEKLSKFLYLVRNPTNQIEANRIKNEIIVELRSQLDKAFLAFYRDKYGNPPLRDTKPTNVYFPVVPDLQGKTVEKRLRDYFQHMLRIPNFATDFPELFQYLKSIQPLHNPSYSWLAQLYKLANLQKHDTDLPFEPEVDGIKINMVTFLPQLLDGITELLLKLFHSRTDLATINDLRFSCYVQSTYNPIISSSADHTVWLPHHKNSSLLGGEDAQQVADSKNFN